MLFNMCILTFILSFQFQFVNSFLSLFYIAFYLQDQARLKEVSSVCVFILKYNFLYQLTKRLILFSDLNFGLL